MYLFPLANLPYTLPLGRAQRPLAVCQYGRLTSDNARLRRFGRGAVGEWVAVVVPPRLGGWPPGGGAGCQPLGVSMSMNTPFYPHRIFGQKPFFPRDFARHLRAHTAPKTGTDAIPLVSDRNAVYFGDRRNP